VSLAAVTVTRLTDAACVPETLPCRDAQDVLADSRYEIVVFE
jgi:hypothetical protein